MLLTVRTAPVLPVVVPTPTTVSVLPIPYALPPSIIFREEITPPLTVTLAVA